MLLPPRDSPIPREQATNLLDFIHKMLDALRAGEQICPHITLTSKFSANDSYYQAIERLNDIYKISKSTSGAASIVKQRLSELPENPTAANIAFFTSRFSLLRHGIKQAIEREESLKQLTETYIAWKKRRSSSDDGFSEQGSDDASADGLMGDGSPAKEVIVIEDNKEQAEDNAKPAEDNFDNEQTLINVFEGRIVSELDLQALQTSIMCELGDVDSLARVEQFATELIEKIVAEKERLTQELRTKAEKEARKEKRKKLKTGLQK